jgi:hypothetical protein
MQLPQLKEMVQETRQALLKLVELQVGSHKVYQEDYNIPATVNQQSIVSLAETGYRLFQKIFAGPYADLQTQNLGKKLRQLTQNGQCKIQIFSQDFVLPWGLLYMADRLMPGEAQKDLFLGMSHIVEHIPLQESMQVVSNRMESTNGLAVSLNLNTDIDKATGLPLISSQETYWDGLHAIHPNLQIIRRTTRDEVLKALSGETSTDQVIYFYCHGISNDPADTGGTDTSTLILSNNGRLTLKDLSLYAPIEDQFSSAPLVFINACESAELSPLVYDGFVPYFVAKGARGVIGTEVKVPAKFAVEWAQRFFDRFLKGESIGEATLNLRNEFFEQHNNLLGLLYSLYVDCDTKVVPGIL